MPSPTSRQRLGLALIAGGVVLTPVIAWLPTEPTEAVALGAGTILLLTLGASLLAPAGRPEPGWLRWAWIVTIAAMAGLLGYAIGAADREDRDRPDTAHGPALPTPADRALSGRGPPSDQLLIEILSLQPPAVTASMSPASPPPVATLPRGL